jgi:FkbM family methyltransferase
MKTALRNVLSSLVAKLLLRRYAIGELSYSQEGEDRVLAAIFKNHSVGFYVDVGAHHPCYLSNTQLFYLKGWSGINIDANPDCMVEFKRTRQQDINLTCGVGNSPGHLEFYDFQERALSTFDKNLSEERIRDGRQLRRTISVEIRPLRNILADHTPSGKRIDFMSIDVEGFDLDVLKSNDWNRFRPRVLLVECLGLELSDPCENATYNFLVAQNYRLLSKLINTTIFIDRTQEIGQV